MQAAIIAVAVVCGFFMCLIVSLCVYIRLCVSDETLEATYGRWMSSGNNEDEEAEAEDV